MDEAKEITPERKFVEDDYGLPEYISAGRKEESFSIKTEKVLRDYHQSQLQALREKVEDIYTGDVGIPGTIANERELIKKTILELIDNQLDKST